MWRQQIGQEGEPHKKTQWYREGVSYWEVNDVDIKGSEGFLQTLFFERFDNATRTQHLVALTMLMEFLIVLDCGFGIGRITKNLLTRYFNEMMEVRGLAAVVKLASPSSFPIAQFRSFLSESDFIFAQFRSCLSGSDFHFGFMSTLGRKNLLLILRQVSSSVINFALPFGRNVQNYLILAEHPLREEADPRIPLNHPIPIPFTAILRYPYPPNFKKSCYSPF
ncbi:hypothetical protein Patl1_15714 [Pistacia atlantica]|uniref:Uncharacterized protein n=1 Tax=Pistacia atlantica TaxID=434234 RepID=A0ACC1BBB0_9ROSI|nr:hypothetical protein Patl1_15714 [Pistacia atlantica]